MNKSNVKTQPLDKNAQLSKTQKPNQQTKKPDKQERSNCCG